MKSKGTVRFEIRKDTIDKNGKCLIRLVYQVRGHRRYFSTGFKVILPNWDAINQRAVFIDRVMVKRGFSGISSYLFANEYEIREINNLLADIGKNIYEIETRFKIEKITFNAEMVMACLKERHSNLTKVIDKKNELLEFISDYI